MLHAKTDRKGLGLHLKAPRVERPKGVARRVPGSGNQHFAGQLVPRAVRLLHEDRAEPVPFDTKIRSA